MKKIYSRLLIMLMLFLGGSWFIPHSYALGHENLFVTNGIDPGDAGRDGSMMNAAFRAPTKVNNYTVPFAGTYTVGQTLIFIVRFNANVDVTGNPQIQINLSSGTRYANYVIGSGGKLITFSYTIVSGDQALSGISLGSSIILNGGAKITDAGDHSNVDPTLNSPQSSPSLVIVNAAPPTFTISMTDPNPVNHNFTITIVSSEKIKGPGTGLIASEVHVTGGGTISGFGTSDNITYTATINLPGNPPIGSGTVSIDAGSATGANTNLQNTASNTLSFNWDKIAPTISSVTVPPNKTYKLGEVLTFVVNFSENVFINLATTPYLELVIGSSVVHANYVSGSGGKILTFSYTVQAGDLDSDGITVSQNSIQGVTSIKDAAGNTAALFFATIGNLPNVKVDGVKLVISSVANTANGYYNDGANSTMNFFVVFSKPIQLTGTVKLSINIGGNVRVMSTNAVYGQNMLQFTYHVQPGEQDMDGIAYSGFDASGATITDNVGYTADLSNAPSGAMPLVFVNTTHPTITLSTAAPAQVNQPFTVTATFSEAVHNLLATGFTVTNGSVTSLTTTDQITYTLTVKPTADGPVTVTLPANQALNIGNNGNVAATNTISRTYDGTAPVINTVTNPADGMYNAGSNKTLAFDVAFSEPINVTGTPTLAIVIGSTTRVMNGTLTGGNTLHFEYTVVDGDQDMDGIAYGAFTGTIADLAGNAATIDNSKFGAMPNVLVNTTYPSVALSTGAAALVNQPFTVTAQFSEAVHNLNVSGFTVGNGTASNLTSTDQITYTFTVTPTADGIVTVSLPANQALNIGNNGNTASTGDISLTYDGTAPVINTVTNPADGMYNAGSNKTLAFDVAFSEPINVAGTPTLAIVIGSTTRVMNGTLTGGNTLHFEYTVVDGDQDMDGIAYGAFTGTIADLAGNAATIDNSKFSAMPNVLVNTTYPSVALSTTAPSLTNQPFTVTAQFSEAVHNLNVSGFTVGNGTASNLTSTDQITYTFTVTPTADGIVTVSLPANQALNIGNNGNTASTGDISLTYDGTAPVINTVTNPADGMYNAGSNKTLAFDVAFSEPINVTGTPTLAIVIGSTTRVMNGTLTGGNTLHFEYIVVDGDQDMDGIAYGAFTGTIADLAGNAATIDNSKFGAMPNVLVNTTYPSVALSTGAAALVNQPFTVTAQFSEAVHNLNVSGFTVGNGTASNLTSTDQITYTFTVTPTADGVVTVSLPANQALNIGNNGNTASTGDISLTYDGTAPFIKMVTNPADGMYNAGSNKTLAFDVAFSEPINVTGTPTLAIVIGSTTRVMNGTLTGGNTLHFEYTVVDGDQDMDGIAYGAFTGTIVDLAGNAAVIDNSKFGVMPNVLVNTTYPSVALSTTAPSLTNQPFTVTAQFSEAVHNLNVSGFTVGNGTASNLTSTDQITYTFTVTPTADGVVTVSLPANQALNIGNNGNTASTGDISLTYDGTIPFIKMVTNPADGMYNAGSNKTLAFDVAFSEPINVTGTPTLAIVIGSTTRVMNGTLTGGNTLHFEYTVVDGDQDMDGIAYGAFTGTIADLAGNAATIDNSKFGTMPNVLVNTTHPGVVLSTTAPSLTNQPFTVMAQFSEAVHNLNVSGFTVGNGTASNLTSTDQITYTFTVTPTANGQVTVSLPADQALNIGNNGNTASNQIMLNYDATVPVVSSVTVPAPGTYKIGDQLTFVVNWSKVVTIDPPKVPYLELTIGSTVQHAVYVSGSPSKTYTFVYTVQEGDLDNNGITISQNSIQNVTAIKDAAGNLADLTLDNIGTLTTVNVDGVKPVISMVSNPADGMYNTSNSLLKFDVVFSEPVNVTGTTKLSVVIGSSTKVLTGALTSGNTLHFEYNVTAGDQDMDGIAYGTFDLSGATITDIAGNPAVIDNSKFSAMPNVLVNTTYPTVNLTTAAPAQTNQPVVVTATFSEVVTGLTAAKFNVTNGTAGILTTTDNITYQVTVIPAADGAVSIVFPAGAAMNIGNNGNTVSNTLTFTYDGTAPTVTSVTMPAAKYYNEGSVLQFVVHMSEPVVVTRTPVLNFNIGSTLVTADYTSGTQDMVFKYTVPAGINGAADFSSAAIGLNGGTVQDPAGNNAVLTLTGIPAVTSININTTHPGVVVATTAAARVNTPVDATITFSEAVTGFTASDVTVTNGTITSLTTTDNITYQATIQAAADGTVTTMVPAGVAQNVSNNGNLASNTISFVYDATAPVITATQFSVNGDATANTQIGVLSATETSGILKNWTITDDPTNGAFAIDANGNIIVNDARALNNASGTTVTVKVTVTDGLNTSLPAMIAIKVNLMFFNQTPTLDPINDQSICVDKANHTIQLTNISAVEADQTYTLTISTDQPLFDVLSVSHSGLVTYTLKAAATSAVAHITVTIKDNGGTLNHAVDSLQRTFTFTVLPTPAVTITADKSTSVSKGDNITLTATGGDIYAWAQVDGIISGQFTDKLHARVQANTIYTVTVTNIFNCSNTTDIAVTANVDFKVDANNILTPNGDGINDKWVIKNLDSYPDNELMIYDRAGRLVYQRKNYSNDWDGTSAGNPLAEGTYYYILTIQKSTKATKGYITIIR